MPQRNETTNVMQAMDLLRLFSTTVTEDENSGKKTIPNILEPSQHVGKIYWER